VDSTLSPEWTKLRALALRELDRFIGLEPKVLRGKDPEAIHDMRVASRRLQQVLDLIYPPPGPREVRRLRRRIKRCRRALGEVRNCDVLLERVEKAVAKTGSGVRGSGSEGREQTRNPKSEFRIPNTDPRTLTRRAVWEAAREFLGERRAESFDKAVRKLGKMNVAGVYVGLKEHLSGAGIRDFEFGILNLESGSGVREETGKPNSQETRNPSPEIRTPGPPLRDSGFGVRDSAFGIRDSGFKIPDSESRTPASFYQRVSRSMESAWRDFVEKVDGSHRQPQPSTLHRVRIAAKRLRYLVEVMEAFEVPGSSETVAWLRALQQHLGDWHDLEVMESMLTEMISRPKFIRNHLEMASAVLALIRRHRRRKKGFEEKYLHVTQHSPEYERTKRWAGEVTGGTLQGQGVKAKG
jgi:CHAD domain-containing protein